MRHLLHGLLLAFIVLTFPALSAKEPRPVAAPAGSGKVVGVTDGDTIDVMDQGRAVRLRLYGIDCPEKSQAFGTKAKQFTADLCFGRTVRWERKDVDRYGRSVALVWVGEDLVNEKLVAAGMAWTYTRYCKPPWLRRFTDVQKIARDGKRGLWADSNPTPPWDFRKKKKK